MGSESKPESRSKFGQGAALCGTVPNKFMKILCCFLVGDYGSSDIAVKEPV